MAEIIILGKIALTIVIIIAGINVLSLIKSVFNSLVMPLIEPFFPLLSSIVTLLTRFIESGGLGNCLNFCLSKIGNHRKNNSFIDSTVINVDLQNNMAIQKEKSYK